MKLLFINYIALPIPPVNGGAVENLVDMFLQYNEEHHFHDITVISIYNHEAEKIAKSYKYCKFIYIKLDKLSDKFNRIIKYMINRVPFFHVGNAYISKTKNILKKQDDYKKYDAIIIENAPEFGLILRKIFSGRLILHLHNDYLNKNTKLHKKILDCYDEVYTISNFLKKCVSTIYQHEKIQTLYNGIDLERFNKSLYDSNLIKKSYNVSENDFVILFCGRVVPEKGVKELLTAYSMIENKKNTKLVVVGSAKYGETVHDSYYNDLLKISQPFSQNIIFTGFIPYSDIPPLYSIADVGVIPSLINDAFNLTTVEFMANSVPVIVSDWGAMSEVINADNNNINDNNADNNDCGIVAYSGNNFEKNIREAIEKLIKNKDMFMDMKKNAYKKSKFYSKEKYCERFNYLLER